MATLEGEFKGDVMRREYEREYAKAVRTQKGAEGKELKGGDQWRDGWERV